MTVAKLEQGLAVRLDKWLWAARFFKTRSIAQDAVGLGRVRLFGERTKAARSVQVGDELTIERGPERMVVVVKALSGVRGPAVVAQTLYEETAESKQKREQAALMRKMAQEPALAIAKGRPTKRDMRLIRQVKQGWE